MKCPYCGREVEPNGSNCPRCYAEIIKKNEPKTAEINKEVK